MAPTDIALLVLAGAWVVVVGVLALRARRAARHVRAARAASRRRWVDALVASDARRDALRASAARVRGATEELETRAAGLGRGRAAAGVLLRAVREALAPLAGPGRRPRR